MFWTPSKIYVTSGNGEAEWGHELLAFDRALQDAGVADFNHIQVSSVIPPHAELILTNFFAYPPGQLVPTVYSEMRLSYPHVPYQEDPKFSVISACLAFAIPENEDHNGMIFEVAGNFHERIAIDKATKMAGLAMKDRNQPVKDIKTVSTTMNVRIDTAGCVIVAAVME